MKKDQTNQEPEDINVWEPKDPSKPYLIRKQDGETLHDYNAAKKEGYLQEWREKQCEQVDENKFLLETESGGDFSGLVLPWGPRSYGNYNFAIFRAGGDFGESRVARDRGKGYSFQRARFHGRFTFVRDSSFDGLSPFLQARICKDSFFTIFANTAVSFREVFTGNFLKEPFQGLEIEEGGGFNFIDCHFPEGFTLRNLNLKNTFFHGSNIEKVRFINCEFEEEKGSLWIPERFALADEYPERVKKFSEYEDIANDDELAVMYQLMKKSFEEQKDYQTAGKFYVSEMHFRQKSAKGIKKALLWLYGFCAGYGESVGRTLILLTFCIFTSVVLYYFSLNSLIEAVNSTFSSLILVEKVENIVSVDTFSRFLFSVSYFLFINAIRRRLRRS